MSIDDEDILKCPTCNKNTMHDTTWDAEAPKDLFVTCKECHNSRTIHT